MKTFVLRKINANENCTSDFLLEFQAIVEEWEGGRVVYATPIAHLEEIWKICGSIVPLRVTI